MRKFTLPILLLMTILLVGCTGETGPAYDPQAFTCTLSLQSVSTGEPDFCTARYTSDHGTVNLTVTAPEHLVGVSFVANATGMSMVMAAETEPLSITLSENAASSLRTLTDLLCTPHEEAIDQRKTNEGTVLLFETGELTLDETGMPVWVETVDGRCAKVTYPPENDAVT